MLLCKKIVVMSAVGLLAAGVAQADEVLLKPFVLASKGAGTVVEKTEAAKAALTDNGVGVVGS